MSNEMLSLLVLCLAILIVVAAVRTLPCLIAAVQEFLEKSG